MSTNTQNSRRDFLKTLTSGGLLLGFSWLDTDAAVPVAIADLLAAEKKGFNSYLSIDTDGIITILSPNPELGQNIMTSFSMIIAEELEADWTKVKVIQAPLDTKSFDRQLTGGSGAIPHSWKRLRTAGATAKYMLIQAAANQWNLPASECSAKKGMVIHAQSGKKIKLW